MKKAKKQKSNQKVHGHVKESVALTAGVRKKGSSAEVTSAAVEENSDIADIFGAIRNRPSSSGRSGLNGRELAAGKGSGQRPTVSDGLYREPKKALELSDADFFNMTPRKRQKGAGLSDENQDSLVRREGVDRIISFEELQKLTSSNPKAGTTPNCPFDCDCCF
uniref:DUF1764 domain-containing protein n=1 Tax=Trypanosoma congolense (strain IL3000) TaxID=1068625 RepID=G0UUU9_TRYCI|nr:conserved hypothetical protein [Trypanosoma congolense IL3000]